MREALKLAAKAATLGEAPIGAVIVHGGKIIARGWNTRETSQQVKGHAEMMAIEKACRKLGVWRLEGCELYVTLEPCCMCAGALIQSRIDAVYYGAGDPKGGAAASLTRLFELPGLNHRVRVAGGLLEKECSSILLDFFRELRRARKAEKSGSTGIFE